VDCEGTDSAVDANALGDAVGRGERGQQSQHGGGEVLHGDKMDQEGLQKR
jgi:hypothetical protein